MQSSRKKNNFAHVIELERHIEILLLSNDCVIVPEFGGFVTHHIEAYYDESDTMFFPPIRTIGFNPQLRINDSLLVQSYIEAYDISYPDAIKRIEEDVAELKQCIEINGQYIMNNVGVLGINEHGKYYFKACNAGILTPALYGLSSIEFLPLEHIKSAAQIDALHNLAIDTENVQTVEEKRATTLETEQIYNHQNKETEPSHHGYVKISILRNVAAVFIATIIFFLFSSPLGNQSTLTTSGTQINTGLLYRILPKDYTTVPALAKINLGNKTVERKTTDKKSIATDTQKITKSTYHTIVMASHVTLKNAREYADRLHKRGFNDVWVYTNKHRTKVVLGKYNSEMKARTILNKLNDNSEFADCWLTTITEN